MELYPQSYFDSIFKLKTEEVRKKSVFNLQPYFFEAFELPVHPEYLVERLEDKCRWVKDYSLLHLAIQK